MFQISSCLGIKSPFICLEPNSSQGTLLSIASSIPQDLCDKSISPHYADGTQEALGVSVTWSDHRLWRVGSSMRTSEAKACSCHFLFLPDPTLPLPIPVAELVFWFYYWVLADLFWKRLSIPVSIPEWHTLENAEEEGGGVFTKEDTEEASHLEEEMPMGLWCVFVAWFSPGLAVDFADNGGKLGAQLWETRGTWLLRGSLPQSEPRRKGMNLPYSPHTCPSFWVLLADTWFWGRIQTDSMWILWLIFRGKDHREN